MIGYGLNMGISGGGPSAIVQTFQQANFVAPLTSNLTLLAGTGSPTFIRATTAMQQDGDGKYNQVLAGEARFQGMRRVQNQTGTNSEDASVDIQVSANITPATNSVAFNSVGASYWYKGQALQFKVGSVIAARILLSAGTKSNVLIRLTGQVNNTSTVSANIALTSTQTWYSLKTSTPNDVLQGFHIGIDNRAIVGASDTGSGVVNILAIQIEDLTGQSNQNPGEYVPSTWNDTGAAGVRYFPYANGNTVDPVTHVVTEAQGAALPNAGKGNYLSEAAATNIALWNRDFTNAAWTKTNITPTLTATGIDGAANSASTLTATAINGTVLQAVTLASSTRAQSAFIRRRTGVGAISMTTDGGTTYTDITAQLGATFALVQITQAAVTNPSFGFKIATSGDAIDVDFAQNENNTFATSPILTGAVAVTRKGDVLSYQYAGNALNSVGATYCEFMSTFTTSIMAQSFLVCLLDSTGRALYIPTSSTSTGMYDGTNVLLGSGLDTYGTTRKRSSSWGAAGLILVSDGSAPGTSAFDGVLGTTGILIGIGNSPAGVNQASGTIGNVRIWPTQLPNATLQALTAP